MSVKSRRRFSCPPLTADSIEQALHQIEMHIGWFQFAGWMGEQEPDENTWTIIDLLTRATPRRPGSSMLWLFDAHEPHLNVDDLHVLDLGNNLRAAVRTRHADCWKLESESSSSSSPEVATTNAPEPEEQKAHEDVDEQPIGTPDMERTDTIDDDEDYQDERPDRRALKRSRTTQHTRVRRPVNAFLVFCRLRSAELKRRGVTPERNFCGACATLWKQLPNDDPIRRRAQDAAAIDQMRYAAQRAQVSQLQKVKML